MDLIGESSGYILHRNSDGFIEGYKKKGNRSVNNANIGTDLAHIVTNCTTVEEFESLMTCNKKHKPAKIEPPSLFNDL